MKFIISSKFGSRESFRTSEHLGVDVPLPKGYELHSAQNGIIEKVIHEGGSSLGNAVFVRYENGDTGVFGHLSAITVKEGQPISEGEIIGLSGNSGRVVGENGGFHLHYGLKDGNTGQYVDGSEDLDAIINHSGVTSDAHSGFWQNALDWYNGFADKVVGWEMEQIGKPIVEGTHNFFSDLANTITVFMPDIVAIVTILFGFFIMFGFKLPKLLTYYTGFFVFAVCWLVNASS